MLNCLGGYGCSSLSSSTFANLIRIKNKFNYSAAKTKCHSRQIMQNFCGQPTVSIREYSRNLDENQNLKALFRHKRIFAICFFSSTFLLTWFLQQNKLKRMKRNLSDCVQIPLNKELFGSNFNLYRCHKFVFPGPIVMSGVLKILPTFKFRADDIVVASFPKSGTTWVQEIVYMLTHNFQATDKTSEVLETRFPYLEYPYPGIKAVANQPGMRLIKTHLPYSFLPESFEFSGAKLIYIIRNPRDVAVSYWHFMKLLTTINFTGSFQDFVNLFLADKVPYGPYFDHLRSYTEQEESESVLILSYEELKANPLSTIKKIADFLKIPFTDTEINYVAETTTFRTMSENPSVNYEHWKEIGFAQRSEGNFLRKGEVGDWKNYFTPHLIQCFRDWEKANCHTNEFYVNQTKLK